MKMLELILFGIGSSLFLVSVIGYIYVKIRLRPTDSELGEYYYEFEDQHPATAVYTKWSGITFAGAVIGTLLLFLAVAI